ncbi:MAG: DUF2807 domain-containing protein [Cytophagales bacterium]
MSLPIRFNLVFLFFLVIGCNSPDSWDCFQVAGKEKTELRHFDNFSKILIYDKLDVEIIQADHYTVEIRAGENLISGITTKLSGNRIEIENKNTCELLRNSDKIPLVRIYFDSIKNLQVFSSGTVRSVDTIRLEQINLSKRSNGDLFLTLESNNVFIYSNEFGDAVINGKINNVSIEQVGVGLVDFSQCDTKKAYVFNQGPGTSKVNVDTEIGGIISGNGVLEVYGNPNIRDVNLIDDGKIIYIDP